MRQLLTEEQRARHEDLKAFVRAEIEPFAQQWDREQKLPDSILAALGQRGYLGCSLPTDYGGQGGGTGTFGLLYEGPRGGVSPPTPVFSCLAVGFMGVPEFG